MIVFILYIVLNIIMSFFYYIDYERYLDKKTLIINSLSILFFGLIVLFLNVINQKK